MKQPFTIGITGGSGSGKTFFINKLASYFEESDICLLSQDHYYHPRENQRTDSRGVKNFDLPEAIDQQQFLADIKLLKSGTPVTKQEYVFNNPAVVPKSLTFRPAPLLIVEGLFIFSFPEIEQQLDLKVFIEAKDYVKLTRRIIRDNEERGYDLNDVLYRYQHHVMPVYESLIEPLKHNADLIVPNNRSFDRALNILVDSLRMRLKEVKT
jgi:uridine kinase